MIARRKMAVAVLVVAGAAVFVGLGRVTAGNSGADRSAADRSYAAGRQAGRAQGLDEGRAQGVQEGRALQEGMALPADARDAATAAFNAGYAAGANDVFGGYDGGWSTDVPYLITLVPGTGGVTYRIGSRTTLAPGLDYYLCPGQERLCQQPR